MSFCPKNTVFCPLPKKGIPPPPTTTNNNPSTNQPKNHPLLALPPLNQEVPAGVVLVELVGGVVGHQDTVGARAFTGSTLRYKQITDFQQYNHQRSFLARWPGSQFGPCWFRN